MKEARNEELAEESDKKQRTCNIILHGVDEAEHNDKDEANNLDNHYVTSFIETYSKF